MDAMEADLTHLETVRDELARTQEQLASRHQQLDMGDAASTSLVNSLRRRHERLEALLETEREGSRKADIKHKREVTLM